MLPLFREPPKCVTEADRKPDESVPAVAKAKSNFLLNGRIGFHAYQKLAAGLNLLTEGAWVISATYLQDRKMVDCWEKVGLIDRH